MEEWCIDKTNGIITLHAPTPLGSDDPVEVLLTDGQATQLIEALARAVGMSVGHRCPSRTIPVFESVK